MERPERYRMETQERSEERPASPTTPAGESAAVEALALLRKARGRMLEAAIAFCDGLISVGQLKAVREMLREQEERIARLGAGAPPSPAEASTPAEPARSALVPEARLETTDVEPPAPGVPTSAPPELAQRLEEIDRKLADLQQALEQGEVNSAQFQAVKKHYEEQRLVALELHRSHPSSERWRVVLEEGKTEFLIRLNEAACHCVAFYDLRTQDPLYVQGELPSMAQEAVTFLRTFGGRGPEEGVGRMYATHTDEGDTLMLIPGTHTAALIVFSEDPPSWQVRALKEVQRNFELANRAALAKGERRNLVYPNMKRFIKN